MMLFIIVLFEIWKIGMLSRMKQISHFKFQTPLSNFSTMILRKIIFILCYNYNNTFFDIFNCLITNKSLFGSFKVEIMPNFSKSLYLDINKQVLRQLPPRQLTPRQFPPTKLHLDYLLFSISIIVWKDSFKLSILRSELDKIVKQVCIQTSPPDPQKFWKMSTSPHPAPNQGKIKMLYWVFSSLIHFRK